MLSQNQPLFALDHITMFTRPDPPEVGLLEQADLQSWGGVTRHGDLGTASMAFFFENTYLELLWAHDEAQARQTFDPLGLDVTGRADWRETGASPFGLMLYRRAASAEFPWPTRRLRASWMPGTIDVEFAGERPEEPSYGIVPAELSYASFRANVPEPAHRLGVKRLTGIRLTVTSAPGKVALWLANQGLAAIKRGPEPLLRLTFDEGNQGQVLDMRPGLPLMVKY